MEELRRLLSPDDTLLKPLLFGGHTFPGIWKEMMPEGLFDLNFPKERRATCMNCPKSCYDGFRADYRCCTYHPRISNFLLGLASLTPEGDAALDRLLRLGMLTPEGMYSTPGQWIDFLDDQQKDDFGRSEKVLCPMLNPSNGYCDVHAFRNSVCSTFFCISDHGQTGESFWVQVQTLGSQIELVLAQWALKELGFDLPRYIQAFDELSTRIGSVSTKTGWTDEALALLWGDFRGREKELMVACATLIVKNRDRLWSIANEHKILESRAFDEAMDTLVPEHLEDEVEDVGEGVDIDGDEVTLRPEETWEEVREAHIRLWNLPKVPLRLSPNVTIEENERESEEEKYYEAMDWFVVYRFHPHEAPQWTLPVTDAQKNFLELFSKPVTLDKTFFSSPGFTALSDGRTFLSEAINKRVLWPVSIEISQIQS